MADLLLISRSVTPFTWGRTDLVRASDTDIRDRLGPMNPGSIESTEKSDEPVRHAVRTYAALAPELRLVTSRYVAIITTMLDDAGINYLSITSRTKSVASFAAKAVRLSEGAPLYADPLTQITDVVGIRVITYLQDDVVAVAQLFADQLTIIDDRDLGEETARDGRFGYSSRHLLISSPAIPERPASVQVRTVLQHAWAEFEHDIRYKGTVPAELAPDLERRFTLAAGLLELADREFSEIRNRLQSSAAARHPDSDPADPRISPQELATFLTAQYPEARWSRTDHYSWISGLLLELGITSLDELGGLLASVDMNALITRMGYRYPAGVVRRLDDALLAVFGERYVHLTGNAHRVPLLTSRLDKMSGRSATE
jgi:putative GTP pyrophosphokinase